MLALFIAVGGVVVMGAWASRTLAAGSDTMDDLFGIGLFGLIATVPCIVVWLATKQTGTEAMDIAAALGAFMLGVLGGGLVFIMTTNFMSSSKPPASELVRFVTGLLWMVFSMSIGGIIAGLIGLVGIGVLDYFFVSGSQVTEILAAVYITMTAAGGLIAYFLYLVMPPDVFYSRFHTTSMGGR
jgi:hypothetical protein